MERGPIPPHERTWRHPSELAAQERLELRAVVAPRTTRVTALAAGTFGLIVVAALVLVVTPRHHGSPIAISATTIAFDDLGDDPALAASSSMGLDLEADAITSAIGITGPMVTDDSPTTIDLSDRTTITTIATVTTISTSTTVTTIVTNDAAITSTTIAAILAALATPVGDGMYALVTTKSIDGKQSGTVSFRLPSGVTATGEIVFELNDMAVVALPNAHAAHAFATHAPGHTDMVTVMSDTPVDIAFGDIAHTDVPEGTPVIDGAGGLVGLCSKLEDGTTTVIDAAEVGDDLSDMPSSSVVVPSGAPTTTSVPTTTSAPTTTSVPSGVSTTLPAPPSS